MLLHISLPLVPLQACTLNLHSTASYGVSEIIFEACHHQRLQSSITRWRSNSRPFIISHEIQQYHKIMQRTEPTYTKCFSPEIPSIKDFSGDSFTVEPLTGYQSSSPFRLEGSLEKSSKISALSEFMLRMRRIFLVFSGKGNNQGMSSMGWY